MQVLTPIIFDICKPVGR